MSSLIIDGYNLIGIHHHDLSRHRDGLIDLLVEYRKRKDHDITIVFDGWKSGGHSEESFIRGGIRVIFSRLGDKADFVIKRIISRDKKEWIVITSDRDIASFAWTSGSIPVSSSEFLSVLQRAGQSITGDYELLEDNDESVQAKGNPRKRSKKEKALQRAIRKLQ